jgi:manganese-transporting P-type ATPase
LGDASLASPFTAKSTSLDCVLTVVRQGRTSLVTTIQVYKILALNCLVSAFMLSTLYLYGVKQGDTQMTVFGLFIASLFYFSSVAMPLETLSKQKPVKHLFCTSVIVSVVGQSCIHILTLLKVIKLLAFIYIFFPPL